MNNIVWLSRSLSVAALMFIAFIPITVCVIWLTSTEEVLLSNVPMSLFIPKGILFEPGYLTDSVRLAGACVALLANLPLLLALWQIRQLFKYYSELELFRNEAAMRMKKFATWVLVFAFMQPVAGAATSYVTSVGNPPGSRFISVSLGDTDIATIFVALVMFVIGYVLDEAHRISEENRSFI